MQTLKWRVEVEGEQELRREREMKKSPSLFRLPEFPPRQRRPTVPSVNAPEVNRNPGNDKRHHDQCLERLRDDRSTEKEQANAAQDDRSRDPRPVRTFQVRFSDPKDNQTEDREEVKDIASNAVEGDKGFEFTDNDIDQSQAGIERHGVDGRVSDPCPFPEETSD